MFATTKKFVIIPAMLGFTAAIATMSPAIAESSESLETTATNCIAIELEKTGTCIPLPAMSIRRTATPTSEISRSESDMAPASELTEMASESEMSEPEVTEVSNQPITSASIDALNTPEALSRIPRLPAIVGNIANEVAEDAALFAQDLNADGQDVALND